MSALRIGKQLITTLVRDSMHYPGKLAVDSIALIFRFGVLMLLYRYVFYLRGGELQGITLAEASWSIFFYFVFMTLGARIVVRMVKADVQSGAIEMLLQRPVSYVFYRMAWQLGAGLFRFILLGCVGAGVMFFVYGLPQSMMSWFYVTTLAGTSLLAVILSLCMYMCIGLLAFWIDDTDPVFWVFDKLVMILGGSYIPVAFFPAWMYKVAVFSPMGASVFMTHTVYTSWRSEWWIKMGMQGIWCMVFIALVMHMYSRAQKRVTVNGG